MKGEMSQMNQEGQMGEREGGGGVSALPGQR